MDILKSYQLVTPASSLAVSLDELKADLRIAHTDQDTLLTSLIKSATKQFENDTEMQVMEATYKLVLDCFPDELPGWNANILIWKYPVTTLLSIIYYDSDNTLQELDSSDYEYDINDNPARIRINEIPDTYDRIGAVIINFKSGLANATNLDEQIKNIIKYLASHYYENPLPVMSGTQINEVPMTYMSMIKHYKKRLI